ncbi:MAG TPA: HD domain-containing phosphohydrolase [Terriglobales bacterium]|nr:HD domain-containing phosphohydrolase [Terriglobales bacterium]
MPNDLILVVDDEETIREIVSSQLKVAHFRTRQAANGVEALALLESGEEFDLVLSDLMMPEMDGTALLERAKERYPDMPIVMVTAVHDIQVALQALRNGAYDYLLKPFEKEQLLATVGRALENRRLKRENDNYRTNLELLVADRTQQWKTALSELERSYDMTLEALGDTLDAKDAETQEHTRRVTAYTMAIARKMGLPKEEVNMIARGAFLHDIGKIAIPDEILKKPGKLTDKEMDIMKEHCERGYKIIKDIPFLAGAAEIVYSHQEHYDGQGYPRRLKGNEIPLGARIFSIADTLDAMTVDRRYRPAQSFEAAREEIERWSGRQFDPEIVKVFLEMPDSIWEDLRKDIDGQSRSFLAKVEEHNLTKEKTGRDARPSIQDSSRGQGTGTG